MSDLPKQPASGRPSRYPSGRTVRSLSESGSDRASRSRSESSPGRASSDRASRSRSESSSGRASSDRASRSRSENSSDRTSRSRSESSPGRASSDRASRSRSESSPGRASSDRTSRSRSESSPGRASSGRASRSRSGNSSGRTSSGRASKNRSRRRNSRYYRQQQLRRNLIIGISGAVFLLLLIFGVRACAGKFFKASGKSGPESRTEQASLKSSGADEKNGESLKENTEASSEESDDEASSPAQPVSITVTVVGDCTLGTDDAFSYDTSLNAYYDANGPDYFLQNVRDIFSSDDLTIANMESTFTNSENRQDRIYAFKAPPEFVKILSGSSVEAVNMANNHSHDYGDEGFSDTTAALDGAGIVHFGYEETAVMDVKGVKVGLVGIYELIDHLGSGELLKKNIAKVKEEGAELVIVIFHWGNEKETLPDSNQTTLGRMAIEEGADLVCGHHSHVLQGIENYKGKNIVYSLANFCFGGNSAPSDMDTMIFQQTFTIENGEVKEDNVTNIIPCSVSSASGYNNYQPTPAEGDEKTRILQKIEERSSWISPAE